MDTNADWVVAVTFHL